MINIYITCKDNKQAKSIARALLKKRLIACANLIPISSLYWWKNKIQDHKEVAILAKSLSSKFEKIRKQVRAMHSYELPLIEKISTKANKNLENWVKKQVKNGFFHCINCSDAFLFASCSGSSVLIGTNEGIIRAPAL